MKKTILAMTLLVAAIVFAVGMASCSNLLERLEEGGKVAAGNDNPESGTEPSHEHTYSEDWTRDATHHWKAATCGHTEEKGDFAEHSIEWQITKEPTETQEGRNERTCTVCRYTDSVVLQPAPEGFRFVGGTTITGTESWTPTSNVFVSGRSLTIPDLIVSDHEVTRGEYKAVMGSDPSTASAYDKDGNELTGDDVLNNPVNRVSWYAALVYCNKLSIKENLTPCYTINGSTNPDDWGTVPTSSPNATWDAATCNFKANGYRLPTEAEWEWLARGGENYEYAGSDNVDDVAWYTGNTNGTREVKTKAPNRYGLYNMSGNVWEWCWDWYVSSISTTTPEYGASSGSSRVVRGGSWGNGASNVRCAGRYRSSPGDGDYGGFRVVRSGTS